MILANEVLMAVRGGYMNYPDPSKITDKLPELPYESEKLTELMKKQALRRKDYELQAAKIAAKEEEISENRVLLNQIVDYENRDGVPNPEYLPQKNRVENLLHEKSVFERHLNVIKSGIDSIGSEIDAEKERLKSINKKVYCEKLLNDIAEYQKLIDAAGNVLKKIIITKSTLQKIYSVSREQYGFAHGTTYFEISEVPGFINRWRTLAKRELIEG